MFFPRDDDPKFGFLIILIGAAISELMEFSLVGMGLVEYFHESAFLIGSYWVGIALGLYVVAEVILYLRKIPRKALEA